jgi:hypothetical protein
MKKAFLLSMIFIAMYASIFSYSELPYFNIPIGAKSAAMGGAYSAISGDIETLWYNPAGIAELKHMQLMLSHVSWVGDVNLEYVLFGMPINDFMAAGIAVNYNYTTDRLVDEAGFDYGQFYSSNMIVNGGLGVKWGILDTGCTFKIIKETYDAQQARGTSGENSGFIQGLSGIMCDLGVLGHFFNDYINAAITAQNVFGYVKDDITGVQRPVSLIIRLGIAEKNFIKGLLLTQEYRYNYIDMTGYPAFGIQGEKKISNFNFAARGGYEMQKSGLGGIAGFTVGAGIRYKGYEFNYAFNPYGVAGNAHRFSFGYKFL